MPASSTHCERVQSRGGPASHGADRRTCTSLRRFSGRTGRVHKGDLRQTVDECRVLPGAIFFADAPADIQAREVAGGQGPHGHAEAGKGLVYGFDSRTFFDEELGFAAVGDQTCDYDKPRQLPTSTPTLPTISKVACRWRLLPLKKLTADDLQKPHNIGRTEEMGTDDEVRPRGGGAILIDT